MVAEVFAGISAFKSMFDLAKGLKDLSDATARNAVAIELQEKILTAQAEQAGLAQKVSQLEDEVGRMKNWEADKSRYQLTQLPPGVFVYTLKTDMAAGDPAHHICQSCYQRGKKSILHQGETHNGVYHLRCDECGADHKVGHFNPPKIDYGPRRGSPISWTRR